MNILQAVDDDEDDILVHELVFSECDDDESLFGLIVPAVAFCRPERRMRYTDERRNGIWEEHVLKCRHQGTFVAKYHMTEDSFNNLVHELSPYLWVNEAKSKNATSGIQPIDERLIVAAGLRWLGGHDHSCLEDVFHFSYSSSRRVINKFIDSVIYHLNNINLPSTDEELATVAAGWTIKSTADGCYLGLVLALDGFLSSRTKPRKDDCSNPADYFSGHKRVYGINVQAAVAPKIAAVRGTFDRPSCGNSGQFLVCARQVYVVEMINY
jgi:hypothetical protein